MRVLDVCSGIAAPAVAWAPLGWRHVAFAEIDAFPSAVLAARWPGVPNLGDLNGSDDWPDLAADVLVGGTPCQSFSRAGRRAGMDDPRGQLLFRYLEVAGRYRPGWVVWENVPDVLSSDGGRAFGALLGALGELGYGYAWRVLDAQWFGVAQRRRRVFLVGRLGGDARRAAAVLFEPAGLRGDPAPRRASGEEAAGALTRSTGNCVADLAAAGHILPEIVNALTARPIRDYAREGGALVPVGVQGAVADTLTGSDRAGPSGVPVIAFNGRQEAGPGAVAGSLDRDGFSQCIAFSAKDHGGDAAAEISPTLRAGGFDGSHANGGVMPAVAYPLNDVDADRCPGGVGTSDDLSYALRTHPHKVGVAAFDGAAWAVRRLMPVECERLQGFPDGYTAIRYRGRAAADGPRYKALGNAIAVPVLAWIGRRMALADAVFDAAAAE